MKSSYTAHGKVILIGEHSVVYGYDALALPIKALHIITTVEPAQEIWMDTAKYRGPFFAAPAEYDGLKYVVKTLLAKTAGQEKVKITYTGEIPIERGLGSSATVALGTTKAMNDYFGLGLETDEVMTITNHAEMINHGKASGLDAATVNSDHLVFFNKKTGAKEIAAKLGATLLIMDTGELGSTKQAVNQVHDLLQTNPVAKGQLHELGTLADEAKEEWFKQNYGKIGQIFTKAETILRSFNLATPKINQLEKLALENGALGYKLSGSGLGGIVIALCDKAVTAEKIAQSSKDLISNYWIEEI
ncbi:mevalonate kinase [Lactobacillus sp. ESL0791]|uniref:mevalonate kinase n=1 Tax=Lactobacillus sp. ESL0791 TaxID=2983234 RepID=UPI0023F8FD7F|nr:mevalonate kinase [Lactobacillus sp. ESL0791]MDF7638922.1 mevalonate kinase [Lactobacillus sp. ESL0791]